MHSRHDRSERDENHWQTSMFCTGAMYICTEDAFPNRRLVQMVSLLRQRCPDIQLMNISFTDNIYIEHCADIVCTIQRIRFVFYTCRPFSLLNKSSVPTGFWKAWNIFQFQSLESCWKKQDHWILSMTLWSMIIFKSFSKIVECVLHLMCASYITVLINCLFVIVIVSVSQFLFYYCDYCVA